MANGQWGGLKTVVSAHEVAAAVAAETEAFPRLPEAWDALEWLLARSASEIGRPHIGDETLRLYVQADDIIANVPAIWIVYRVGADQIDVLSAKIVPPAPDIDDE